MISANVARELGSLLVDAHRRYVPHVSPQGSFVPLDVDEMLEEARRRAEVCRHEATQTCGPECLGTRLPVQLEELDYCEWEITVESPTRVRFAILEREVVAFTGEEVPTSSSDSQVVASVTSSVPLRGAHGCFVSAEREGATTLLLTLSDRYGVPELTVDYGDGHIVF